jgi:hypothetical protein
MDVSPERDCPAYLSVAPPLSLFLLKLINKASQMLAIESAIDPDNFSAVSFENSLVTDKGC